MKDQNICEFCGQVLLDGRDCDCYAATKKRETEKKIEDAKQNIQDIFVNTVSDEVVPPGDEALDLLGKCVEAVAYEHITKASIVLPGGVKANLSKKNTAIKVERVETIKSSKEA